MLHRSGTCGRFCGDVCKNLSCIAHILMLSCESRWQNGAVLKFIDFVSTTQNGLINYVPWFRSWLRVPVPFSVFTNHVCVALRGFTCVISMLMFVMSCYCFVIVPIALPFQTHFAWHFLFFSLRSSFMRQWMAMCLIYLGINFIICVVWLVA